MKKRYTRPSIVKVKLNHEQAVLGQCSSGVSSARNSTGTYCDTTRGTCLKMSSGDGQNAS